MRILMSGPSSFTGMHIASALTQAGHQVAGSFRQPISEYIGIKALRITQIQDVLKAESSPIGHPIFCRLIKDFRPEVYIHHGFDTTGYNHPNFPIQERVESSLYNINEVCQLLVHSGCRGIVYSDSIFAGSGAITTDAEVPFSPYGEAKKQIGDRLEKICQKWRLPYWRVVIPNPVGQYDNPKLLQYLFSSWTQGLTPNIYTPQLIRDNIPVSLLAKHYLEAVHLVAKGHNQTSNPSGWICSVEDFVVKASQMWTSHTGLKSPYQLNIQTTNQPLTLHNTEPLWSEHPSWSEATFWKELIQSFRSSNS